MARQTNQNALARERKRREKDMPTSRRGSGPAATTRRSAATACAWCGGPIATKSTGRIPKWCSPACRQRAWEQTRAAASGRAAVEVVERIVHVPADHPQRLRGYWPAQLRQLAAELDTGRIYSRDLPELERALIQLTAAHQRRERARRPRH